MNIKYCKSLFLIIALFFTVACFSQNEITDKKYFSSDIVSKIEDPSSNLYLYWPDYLVTIKDYDLWNEINYGNYGEIDESFIDWWDDKATVIIDSLTFYYAIETDTVLLGEEVYTSNIEGKIVKITPIRAPKNTHFKLSVAVDETIKQYPPLEEYYTRDGMSENDLEVWEKISSYKTLKDSGQYTFRIPDRDSISDIEQLKIDLALRDTSLYYEAESEGRAINYVYKGMPAEHWINGLIIKIEKYNKDVLIETKYIKIQFPEAC